MDEQRQADIVKINLHRVMAANNLTVVGLSDCTGLDQRTVRGILSGNKRAQPRTLHRLAEGLKIDVNELLTEPPSFAASRFDQQSNPMVDETVRENPGIFSDWNAQDFDELQSRMGVGGSLTREGVLAAATKMNRRRQLHQRLDIVLESTQGELIGGMIDLAYRQVMPDEGDA